MINPFNLIEQLNNISSENSGSVRTLSEMYINHISNMILNTATIDTELISKNNEDIPIVKNDIAITQAAIAFIDKNSDIYSKKRDINSIIESSYIKLNKILIETEKEIHSPGVSILSVDEDCIAKFNEAIPCSGNAYIGVIYESGFKISDINKSGLSNPNFNNYELNRELYLQENITYKFIVNSSGDHRFKINWSGDNNYPTNNNIVEGEISWLVQSGTPKQITYSCDTHPSEKGIINILKPLKAKVIPIKPEAITPSGKLKYGGLSEIKMMTNRPVDCVDLDNFIYRVSGLYGIDELPIVTFPLYSTESAQTCYIDESQSLTDKHKVNIGKYKNRNLAVYDYPGDIDPFIRSTKWPAKKVTLDILPSFTGRPPDQPSGIFGIVDAYKNVLCSGSKSIEEFTNISLVDIRASLYPVELINREYGYTLPKYSRDLISLGFFIDEENNIVDNARNRIKSGENIYNVHCFNVIVQNRQWHKDAGHAYIELDARFGDNLTILDVVEVANSDPTYGNIPWRMGFGGDNGVIAVKTYRYGTICGPVGQQPFILPEDTFVAYPMCNKLWYSDEMIIGLNSDPDIDELQDLEVGMLVTGPNIPYGTRIKSIVPADGVCPGYITLEDSQGGTVYIGDRIPYQDDFGYPLFGFNQYVYEFNKLGSVNQNSISMNFPLRSNKGKVFEYGYIAVIPDYGRVFKPLFTSAIYFEPWNRSTLPGTVTDFECAIRDLRTPYSLYPTQYFSCDGWPYSNWETGYRASSKDPDCRRDAIYLVNYGGLYGLGTPVTPLANKLLDICNPDYNPVVFVSPQFGYEGAVSYASEGIVYVTWSGMPNNGIDGQSVFINGNQITATGQGALSFATNTIQNYIEGYKVFAIIADNCSDVSGVKIDNIKVWIQSNNGLADTYPNNEYWNAAYWMDNTLLGIGIGNLCWDGDTLDWQNQPYSYLRRPLPKQGYCGEGGNLFANLDAPLDYGTEETSYILDEYGVPANFIVYNNGYLDPTVSIVRNLIADERPKTLYAPSHPYAEKLNAPTSDDPFYVLTPDGFASFLIFVKVPVGLIEKRKLYPPLYKYDDLYNLIPTTVDEQICGVDYFNPTISPIVNVKLNDLHINIRQSIDNNYPENQHSVNMYNFTDFVNVTGNLLPSVSGTGLIISLTPTFYSNPDGSPNDNINLSFNETVKYSTRVTRYENAISPANYCYSEVELVNVCDNNIATNEYLNRYTLDDPIKDYLGYIKSCCPRNYCACPDGGAFSTIGFCNLAENHIKSNNQIALEYLFATGSVLDPPLSGDISFVTEKGCLTYKGDLAGGDIIAWFPNILGQYWGAIWNRDNEELPGNNYPANCCNFPARFKCPVVGGSSSTGFDRGLTYEQYIEWYNETSEECRDWLWDRNNLYYGGINRDYIPCCDQDVYDKFGRYPILSNCCNEYCTPRDTPSVGGMIMLMNDDSMFDSNISYYLVLEVQNFPNHMVYIDGEWKQAPIYIDNGGWVYDGEVYVYVPNCEMLFPPSSCYGDCPSPPNWYEVYEGEVSCSFDSDSINIPIDGEIFTGSLTIGGDCLACYLLNSNPCGGGDNIVYGG
jgi:hypothetical protein